MMKLPKLIVPCGLALLAAQACSESKPSGKTPHSAGAAGKGGGSGGRAAGGKAGATASGGKQTSSGTGGGSGESGESGHGTGGTGSPAAGRGGGGRGGSAGRSSGSGGSSAAQAGASGEAGAGGEAGGRMCMEATPEDWVDITTGPYAGVVSTFASYLASDELAADSIIALHVFSPDTGTFALGKLEDKNFKTCERCVVADVPVSGEPSRQFFADSGTLEIAASSQALSGVLEADLTDVRLVEVTIDDLTYESTPVEGGGCIHVAASHISIDPNVPPDGAGGASGAGGEGGTSGEGGAGGAPDVPTGCIEIAVGSSWISSLATNYAAYLAYLSPNLGSPSADVLDLSFWGTNELGSFELGQGIDATFSTCEHCFLVNVADGTYYGRNFFGVDGTLDVNAGSVPLDGILDASATDVTFIEVEDDLTTPITGGQCLHLETATWSLP